MESTLDQFEYISKNFAQLFRSFDVPQFKRNNCASLALWGPSQGANAIGHRSSHNWLTPWNDRIIQLNGPHAAPVAISPWSAHPEIKIVGPTAHTCAAYLVTACWDMVFDTSWGFDDSPYNASCLKQWNEYIEEFLDRNWASILKRTENVSTQACYPEWCRLASLMDIERVKLMNAEKSAVATHDGIQSRTENDDQTPTPQWVTLDMIAALVNRSKKTLERWVKQGKLPSPDVEGGGGKPHEWNYLKLRPALEQYTEKKLPPNFPGCLSPDRH